MEYPQVINLYKYCAFNTNSLSILINKKIWVSKPDSLNDPFDCKIRFKPALNAEAERKYLDKRGITGDDPRAYQIQKRLREFEDVDIQNLGVFCLSELNDNILMWSHYADQHRGFCIEFVRSSGNWIGNFETTKPINYCNYPEVDPFDSDGNIDASIHRKMLLTKAEDWKYENEWRLTYPQGDKEESLPGEISSIIFGLRMPDADKNTIRNILADQPDIRYRQVAKVECQFRVKIVDL